MPHLLAGGGGHGRSGGNASADSSEVPLTLASLWARNLDAYSTTVNAQSTHSQRTVNAQSTHNETCLRVPCFRHTRVFKSFPSKKNLFEGFASFKTGAVKAVSFHVDCALTVRRLCVDCALTVAECASAFPAHTLASVRGTSEESAEALPPLRL